MEEFNIECADYLMCGRFLGSQMREGCTGITGCCETHILTNGCAMQINRINARVGGWTESKPANGTSMGKSQIKEKMKQELRALQ